MSDREMALFANAAFYAAFAARDMTALERLWAEGEVTCIHPGWPPLTGRSEVIGSWRRILTGRDAPDVSCRRAVADIRGLTAIVICIEIISVRGENPQALAATNVFVRSADAKEWRMVHHQAGSAHIDPSGIEEEEVPAMN